MPEYLSEALPFVLLFGVGIFASIMNVMAGGGSTLTLPTLIFLGLDSATANGSNRVAILVQNIAATISFRREKIGTLKLSFKLGLFTLPGAIIGALMATKISDEWFQKMLVVVMIGVILSIIFGSPKMEREFPEGQPAWKTYLTLVAVGFYGGFIQVGVGFILIATLFHVAKMKLVFVNMHKLVIVLIYTIPALGIFAYSGNVSWLHGLILAGGNATGAWFGAKLAVKKGDKFIRLFMIGVIAIMAIKLMGWLPF